LHFPIAQIAFRSILNTSSQLHT